MLFGHRVSTVQLIHPNFSIYRLCEGGELFYHITKKKHLTEQ
jgi:calcium-dependent protein kinase